MQPPPQTVPPGTSGPPPMGMPPSTYWRSSAFSKRSNVPVSGVIASVQPVTDPFAFGKKTSQSTPLNNASKGNPLASPIPSSVPQPITMLSPHAADYSHGVHMSQPGSATQHGANLDISTNILASSASPAHLTSSNTVTSPVTEPVHQNSSGPPYYNMGAGHQNTVGAHFQIGVPFQNQAQSNQDITRDLQDSSAMASTTGSFLSHPPPQGSTQWRPIQGGPQPSVQTYLPFAALPFQNTAYGAHHTLSSSNYTSNSPVPSQIRMHHAPVQHQQVQQNITAAPLPVGGNEHRLNISQSNSLQFKNSIQPENRFHQNTGLNNPWFSQPYQEQFHPQPYLPEPSLLNPIPPAENTLQDRSEATDKQILADRDTGTISMFFKGDEAENKEIISLDPHAGPSNSCLDSLEQNPGLVHLPPVHPHQVLANVVAQTPNSSGSTSETAQKGTEVQQYFSQTKSNQHDTQATSQSDGYNVGDKAIGDNHSNAGPQYDNVENVECIQNLEVLPGESLRTNPISASTNSDPLRYGSLTGQMLPQNSIASHAEGGPNLETPDSVPHAVRSDSVSSNYSGMSHRSASSSSRPQEVAGTFIQQESGKLDDDFPTSFFKQIDSSPLGADSCEQNSTKKSYHNNMPQPSTPSPPKPTGIFQTSANSSFEPVRSHGVGVKPAEVDQAKMVGEVREPHTIQKNTNIQSGVPVASPGNLEQPPDNLETIFLPQVHTFGHIAVGDPSNLLQPVKGPSVENVPLLIDKRPLSRAHGANKKCESPATTLWAQNELPVFGGNVLLAPAAPPVYVTPKPQTTEIIQPPEDGLLGQESNKMDSVLVLPLPDGHGSENLENPPKMGEDEPLHSQASSGYASLLSSPPTESLQNPPVLITQPNQSYSLAQPINFSLSLPNRLNLNQNNESLKETGIGDRSVSANQAPHSNSISGESGHLSFMQPGCITPPVPTNLPNAKSGSNSMCSPEKASSSTANLLIQPPPHQFPLNLITETQKNQNFPSGCASKAVVPGMDQSTDNTGVMLVPPLNMTMLSNSSPSHSIGQEETAGALDFTISRVPASQSTATNFMSTCNQSHAEGPVFPQTNTQTSQVEAEASDKQPFYRQLTKGVQQQQAELERGQQGALSSQQQMQSDSQLPMTTQPPVSAAYQKTPGSVLVPGAQVSGVLQGSMSLPPAEPAQPSREHLQSSSGPAGSANSSQPIMQQGEQKPPPSQTPQHAFGPPVDPSGYYYYRHPYGAYPPHYQQSYPQPDPRAAHLYYQVQEDAYGTYDPGYRQYDNSSAAYVDPGKYRYSEPERPSSRSSQCSDRPPSRQEYPDYCNPKNGWSSHSDYYANYYYLGNYDYGDPTQWDRYSAAYDPRYRDPRSYDRRYWYDTDHDYQRLYPTRRDGYDNHWQYDPRFAGSFDDENEPHRDPYGDECDRRSVHSEHSVHSLHSSHSVQSRRSSFSSRSQQSQVYKGQQDLTANAYGAVAQIGSLHTDYSYGLYSSNFSNRQTDANYQYDYATESGWQPVEQVPSRPLTPEKFSVPHVCSRFGPGGYFIKILPNLPSEGQPALVEIHNMETMLQHIPEQEEMRAFPGPLTKDETHKVDVINFAQNKAVACFRNENLIDKESASLLWEFIVLLCRQNGTVVGTDIAELLLRDHKTVWLPGKSPNEANLIDFNNEAMEQVEEESGASQLSFLTDTANSTANSDEKEIERFRELLLYGRKKDALESAMKHGLWGHALLLASKMDSRTHARVMTRFANSLPINDPLQTVYQLMSGRMPAASTCCGDEKWGDWRPHLAMVLSNLTNNMDVESRTMITMGDTLVSKGLLEAAHFCYLMAQIGFGVYTKKTTKLVLIGSNHSSPFGRFASNDAIQRTEAYEYAQSLGTQPCSLPNFQVFKFIYACRLAEMGLAAQAFHYCEVISKSIIKHPSYYSPVLIDQLIQVSSQLRFFDPQLKEKPEQEQFIQPDWLVHLQHLDGQIKQGAIVYSSDRATPQQYACSTPSSELDHISQSDGTGVAQELNLGMDNPLMATLIPNTVQPIQGIQLALPDSQTILGGPYSGLQDSVNSAASYPMAPPPTFLPGLSFTTPVPTPGFAVPYGTEQTNTYSGSAPPQMSPSTKANEFVPEEQWNPEPVLQRRISQESPTKKTFHEHGTDFYEAMGKMAPMPRSRTTSQSSAHLGYGRRSRTTSESSNHSVGSGRRNSAAKQPSPPPPPAIPEVPRSKESKANTSHGKSGRSWFPLKIGWLMGKGKNEAHLPDDTDRSIVWDEKKQRWVNLDEPEEENKPPPPPPPGIVKVPQTVPTGSGAPPNSSVNMFSIRAGSRGRYVDVLNPAGNRSNSSIPPPSDLFAPLAPMPIPTNLFVPSAVPAEGSDAKQASAAEQTSAETQLPSGSENPAVNMDGSGELSRSSSMSSLSREVSQHFPQAPISATPLGSPSSGTVPFYNPSQFAQPSASAGASRTGRFGQRKYPSLK
ncbi:protein transport protein Sec16A isoform X2 [Rhinatrema bivittatum]|uniref:protein transport protein Sec16A isoform X2 n=1 Tax=Rhinatrema bivittatum TaxID=194408 RepID=UPI00112DA24B|nr:protein transport protein Sec16A isoform X2 [Rhinatrema bivittatum]